MYPKNAASPQPIAIGAVVQISDGAVQTSGCTVRIMPIGVAEGDGAGTTAYSTDGIVYYTPTQAETNYTSFILIAKKTGCIPVALTVVTTSSVTPGTVLLAPVTHTSAVVPTVTTLTNLPAITNNWLTAAGIAASALNGKGDWNVGKTGYTLTATTGLGNQTANITGNVSGSVGSVTGGVTVSTNNDKTGYALSVSGLAAISTWTVAITGNITGNVSGSVGSVTGLTTGTILTALGTGTWMTAVPWNAAWDAEVQSEVQDAIEVNHLDHLLAADYDPASKPGVSTALLNELIGSDAGVSQFTANALELAPSGGGGGGDATEANQLLIIAAVEELETQLASTGEAY